jgi:hypothetical protein
MFFGFVPLGTTTFGFPIQVTNGSRTPSTPDAAPTWAIFGPSFASAILTGTAPSSDVSGYLGLRGVTNVGITLANGFAAGLTYTIRANYALSTVGEVDIGFFTVT